jgi:hypothetical protein
MTRRLNPVIGRARSAHFGSSHSFGSIIVIIRTMLHSLVVVCSVLTSVDRAVAEERRVWRHTGGFFENTQGNDWTEKSQNGMFELRERTRNELRLQASMAPGVAVAD